MRPHLTVEDGTFRLVLDIAPGWHLQANPASEPYLVPTEVQGPVRNARYPEGERLQSRFSQEAISVYSGRVEITGEFTGTTAGDGRRLTLTYQPCDDSRCLPPVTREIHG